MNRVKRDTYLRPMLRVSFRKVCPFSESRDSATFNLSPAAGLPAALYLRTTRTLLPVTLEILINVVQAKEM